LRVVAPSNASHVPKPPFLTTATDPARAWIQAQRAPVQPGREWFSRC